ncbi:ABC transporter ATP-binding protein, partial [Candidatus Sumerlaeota bacterium]|nr:ABC transporter ATP-binding protein [Candidatus Sumerlaeota bacterium]
MIQAEGLSKRYMIYGRPIDRLHDWFAPESRRWGKPFWALRDINLTVAEGTSLGVVGVNGAGKSTLLKLLTGTTVPTSGTYSIRGRVSALLELGMGFHPQFTGRENILFNGKMLGLTDAELRERTPAIIEFAEIGDFIDQPLRTYSSGMSLRLAFAIAASVEPDVLIIDEALSVGDLHFQQKCLARIRRFQEAGVTILFVSHDPALIKSFCTEAILLDGGLLIDHGKPGAVL